LKIPKEIVSSAVFSISPGTGNIPMDAKPWGLKPGNCPALWSFNPPENLANFMLKNRLSDRMALELFPTLFILVYDEKYTRHIHSRSQKDRKRTG
jgi:hypothetical protein